MLTKQMHSNGDNRNITVTAVIPQQRLQTSGLRYHKVILGMEASICNYLICPIAIAYRMGQIIKPICVCVSMCPYVRVSVCPSASTLRVAFLDRFSRVCAVAQYAVLEANAKVNGRGQISHPRHSHTPGPISISLHVPPESRCAKFGWNRFGRYIFCACVKKHGFVCIFC